MAIVSCGGTAEETSSAASSGKAQFVKHANAVCERESVGLEKAIRDYLRIHRSDHGPPQEQREELTDYVLLPTIEAEVKAIYYLRWPKQERPRLSQILYDEKRQLDTLALKGKIPSIRFLEQRFEESAKELEAFGLSSCVNGLEDTKAWALAAAWQPSP